MKESSGDQLQKTMNGTDVGRDRCRALITDPGLATFRSEMESTGEL